MLKQGSRIVLEYVAKFNELGQFVGRIIDTEANEANHFGHSLCQEIQSCLAPFSLTTYTEVLQQVIRVEQELLNSKSYHNK